MARAGRMLATLPCDGGRGGEGPRHRLEADRAYAESGARPPRCFPRTASTSRAPAVRQDGRRWPSVTNVGVRPTFGGDALTIETFLLAPLAGAAPATIRVEFLRASARGAQVRKLRSRSRRRS